MRPRREQVDQSVRGTYHCTSRLVRGAFLLNGEHDSPLLRRKPWLEARLRHLASIFAIDVDTFSIMDNHMHLVLSIRPDITQAWSAREVAERWLRLFRPKASKDERRDATEEEIANLVRNRGMIARRRERLCNLGEFHKAIKQQLAQLVNREEKAKGAFWAPRYKSKRVLDTAARLATMAYVDLNPVRAGMAATPEESAFTGIFHRAQHRHRMNQDEFGSFLTPIESTDDRRGMFTHLTLDQYLSFVDRVGRAMRTGKRGHIAADLAPILERLELDVTTMLDDVAAKATFFGSVIGKAASCAREALRCSRQRVVSAMKLDAS